MSAENKKQLECEISAENEKQPRIRRRRAKLGRCGKMTRRREETGMGERVVGPKSAQWAWKKHGIGVMLA
jgi:hypothetical protein